MYVDQTRGVTDFTTPTSMHTYSRPRWSSWSHWSNRPRNTFRTLSMYIIGICNEVL